MTQAVDSASPHRFRSVAYGGSKFIDWLMGQGLCDLSWECGADSWNEYVRSQTACLRQLWGQPTIGGVTVDLNNIQRNDCGAWMPHGAQQPEVPDGDQAPAAVLSDGTPVNLSQVVAQGQAPPAAIAVAVAEAVKATQAGGAIDQAAIAAAVAAELALRLRTA